MQKNKLSLLHWIVIIAGILFLIVPVIGTFLYSFTSNWTTTLLPQNYTTIHYQHLWQDSYFWVAFGHSLLAIAITMVFSTVCIIPVVFLAYYRYPKLKALMEFIILLPFAIPPVVAAIGLMNIWANSPIQILGTPYILWGSYFVITVPFVYRSLANNLEGIALHDLIDAAHLLGASTLRAFISIILPGLRKGMLVSFCLCFSILLGEFVFSNLLAGSQYETLQVYLNLALWKDTHVASAIVLTYFVITLIFTLIAIKISEKLPSPQR